jgi:hypothetical protein
MIGQRQFFQQNNKDQEAEVEGQGEGDYLLEALLSYQVEVVQTGEGHLRLLP